MEMKELFGSYVSMYLPKNAVDISDVRQIPDNQEVFGHPITDQSMIIEILEFVEGGDEEAIKTHFEDLASSNDAQGPENSSINLVEAIPSTSLSLEQATSAYYLSGQQRIAKFKEVVRNTVNVHLGLFRLSEFNTDIVITLNDPVNIDPESSSHAAVPVNVNPWTVEEFKQCLQTFKVINTDLFGNEDEEMQ